MIKFTHFGNLTFIVLLLCSCNNIDITWDLPKIPVVETNSVEVLDAISVRSGGNIIDDGGSSITDRGIIYSLNINPTLNDSVISEGRGSGNFTVDITGLNSGTYYYLKAYASNIGGTGYGKEVKFFIVPFSLKTSPVSSITQTTAISGGSISSDGGASILQRGVCWDKSPNPTIDNGKTIDGTGKGSFISTLTGLNPNTTYYVRSYAVNKYMTAYGDELTFTTQKIDLPTITTTAVSSVTMTSAKSGGTITNDGGATIPARGVCWNATGNPTIADSKTNDGSGSGIYTSSLTELNSDTKYYLRAYATNAVGTAYGGEFSFTTRSSNTSIPTDGLVAYYPFNGNANDESGNGNDGIIYGNSTQFVSSRFDKAIKFDNSRSGTFTVNDYVDLPKISLNEFSVSHWVRFVKGSSTSYDGCTYSIGEFPGNHFMIRISNSGRISGALAINKKWYMTSPVDISNHEWYFITVTVDKNNMTIYKNDKIIGSTSLGFDIYFINDFQSISLHRFSGSKSSRFTGELDNFRIYNRTLTTSEVEILFNE